MCLKFFLTKLVQRSNIGLIFFIKITFSPVQVTLISFILGYIIDMLLVFKEVKFGYGTDMDSGNMHFFICSSTGKYQF